MNLFLLLPYWLLQDIEKGAAAVKEEGGRQSSFPSTATNEKIEMMNIPVNGIINSSPTCNNLSC